LKQRTAYHFSGLLAVVAVSILVCFRFYADILADPGAYLFGAEGDGLKNYFTIAYHAVHGKGLHFKGMLHLYGDHLLFADGQPLLTAVLQRFSFGVVDGHRIIGIMNLLMIGSVVACAALVYLILRRSLVAPMFAVPFAVVIAFLSPQLGRFAGHYALSYTCFIPLIWYLLIRLEVGRSWVWAALLAAAVLAFTFIQPYYLLIAMVFIGAVVLWDLILYLAKKKKTRALLQKAVSILLPFIVFTSYMALADPYSDRPTAPYGVMDYVASFQSVFVPVMEPFKSLFTSYFFRLFVPAQWEGYAFVGFVPALCGVCASGLIIYRRKWRGLLEPVLPDSLRTVLIPAFIVLLFSMGVFHLLGLNWVAEHVSAIRQFRSLGRLAWVFYYVFSLWAVVYVYRLFRYLNTQKNGQFRPLALFLVTLCLGWWTLDAIVNIKSVKEQMLRGDANKEVFGPSFRDELLRNNVHTDRYQAIIALPFELVGSEKLELNALSPATPTAMRASFSIGIPLVNGVMSRTSMKVTEHLAQWVAHPLMPHSALAELTDRRDLLLLVADGNLTDGERFLLDISDHIYDGSGFKAYGLKLDAFAEALGSAQSAAAKDSLAVEVSFLHNGESQVEADGTLLDTALAAGPYEFSFWIRVDPNTTSLPVLEWTEGRQHIYSKRCGSSADIHDGWLRVAQPFDAVAGRKVQFWFRGIGGTVCRTLLRPKAQNVRCSADGRRFYNNFPVAE
jgi:hypothetical protein